MKADLYIQGQYWATIDLPGDGLLALLAKGMVDHAEHQARLLSQDLNALGGVSCKVSLRYKQLADYRPEPPEP